MEIKKLFTTKNILFTGLIIAIGFILVKMTDIALMLFIAFVLSCSLNPLVDKLSTKIPRPVAASLTITGAAIALIGLFVPIITMTVTEIKALVNDLPNQLNHLDKFVSTFNIAGYKLNDILNANVTENTQKIANDVASAGVDFTVGLFGALAMFFIMTIILYYSIAERDTMKKHFIELFPPKYKKKAQELHDNISTQVGGYVTAQLLSTAVIGIIVTFGLTLLNVEYAVVLGFSAAILDLIPIVGPTIALIIALLATAQTGWVNMLLVVIIYLIAQGIQNYVARPMLFGKYLNLHPLAVILSFLIAAKFLGVWGVIFAPAIAALVLTLFHELYVKPINNGRDE